MEYKNKIITNKIEYKNKIHLMYFRPPNNSYFTGL